MSDQAPETQNADRLADTPALRRIARWLPFAMMGHFIVGVPALLISLVVAYGTFVQAGATQRMQQAAAWPFVAYQTGNYTADGQRLVNLSLTNNGLGPAIIGAVEVSFRGRALRSPVDLLTACCGYREGQAMQLRTSAIVNVALRPGEELMFMSLPAVTANAGMVDRLDAVREQIKVRACYCSIFDDCWTIEGPQVKPRPVKACPTNWTVWRQR
ncbi:hypothetical protein [Sandarakinorhabdus sp.]|uniref:hypothetical protein n=1 Tax=Sandarakinorhabdus sp. TaxID=1916663 RepID=UPI00333E8C07